MRLHVLIIAAAIALAGCGLTPKQIEAMGKMRSSATMCHTAAYGGFAATTVLTVAGDGKQGALVQVAPTCATGNARGVAQ